MNLTSLEISPLVPCGQVGLSVLEAIDGDHAREQQCGGNKFELQQQNKATFGANARMLDYVPLIKSCGIASAEI